MTDVLGTCREAFENRRYDKLVKKYDTHTAEQLISEQLRAAGSSIEEFRTYKKVKRIVQNGGLNVARARETAENMAKAIFRDDECLTA